jgi:chromosome partitioning protein
MIVLIGSQKGGCGKSTIATNLAATAALNGRDVVLIDSDSQCTSATWAADREGLDVPQVACVQKVGNITNTAKELATKYDLVIIDAGGRDSQELRTGLLAADLLIAPFKPSQADLDTVFQLSDVVGQAKDFNASLVAVAVLTMSPTHPANTEIQDSKDYLSEHMTVLDCLVHDRKAYRDALSMGRGVVEHSDTKAKNEIIELYKVIKNGS